MCAFPPTQGIHNCHNQREPEVSCFQTAHQGARLRRIRESAMLGGPKDPSTLHSTNSQSKVQAAPSCKICGAEQTGHTGAQGKLWLYYTPSTEHGRHILQPRGENWRSIKNRAMMGVQWQVLRSCTDWSHRSAMKTLAALLPMHRAWPPHTASAR